MPYKREMTYSEPWQKPPESTENESLNKADDIQESPTFDSNTVTSKENGDGTIDSNRQSKD